MVDNNRWFVANSLPGGVAMTGKELREARISKSLTQKKLGELLGYEGRSAETTVQKWEYDSQPIPMRHYKKLSKLLDIPLEKFLP